MRCAIPSRTPEHEVGSIAATSVRLIWETAGAAVEEVACDYGEDFLVQTSWNGVMDYSRIWVQVKGRRHVKKNPRTGNPLPLRGVTIDHALRWSKTADLVVVIVWDLTENEGWYALPRFQVDGVSLMTSENRTTSIDFSGKCIFDVDAARELAWQARQEHAIREISGARWFPDSVDQHAIAMMQFDMLCKLGVITSEGVEKGVDDLLRRCYLFFSGAVEYEPAVDPVKEAFGTALLFYLIDKAQDSGTSLDLRLAEELADGLEKILLEGYSSIEEWVAG